MKGFSLGAQRLVGQPMFKLMVEANELEMQGKKIIHFEIGDPYWATPNFVIEEAYQSMLRGETHYVSSMGIPELRDAICEDVYKTLGYKPSREQVLIAPANAIIYFLTRCVVNSGEEVLIPDPGFPTYDAVCNCAGIKAVPIPLRIEDGFRMRPQDVECNMTDKTRLIIMNSPHNPTGAMTSSGDAAELYHIADENDVYLLSDEVYNKINYGALHSSPSIFDACKIRTILLGSFSKIYSMSGWRLGYAVGPEDVISKMGLLLQTIVSCCPPFIQRSGISVLKNGQDFIAKELKELIICRDTIVSGLNDLPGVTCLSPDGAFYAFPNISGTGLTSAEFSLKMLYEAGVVVCPGSMFGKYGEGHVRFSYATPLINIHEAIESMKRVLK